MQCMSLSCHPERSEGSFHSAQIRVPGYKWLITGSLSEAAAGSDAVVNDSPVGCQSRGVTEPAGESCHRR